MSDKEREKAILNEFKTIYSDFPLGRIKEFEEPDFLIISRSETVGIELVDYVRGQSNSGSVFRRDEKLHEIIANKAQSEYEAKNRTPLTVLLYWYGHRHLRKARVRELAESVAEVVAEWVPEGVFEMVRVGQEQLAAIPLSKFVHSISVIRVRNSAQILWSSSESGWPGVGINELQEIISSKETKIEAYLQNCDSVWLVIVADGRHISSVADLEGTIEHHPFRSRFYKVLFFNNLTQNVIALESDD